MAIPIEKREAKTPQGVERMPEHRVFMPRADIYETADGIVILADMPGVDENGVDITVEDDVLSIYGTVQPLDLKGHEAAYAEYEVGDYERAFALGEEFDIEKISASMKDGVLKLVLPKAVQARTHKIKVKSE